MNTHLDHIVYVSCFFNFLFFFLRLTKWLFIIYLFICCLSQQ